MGNKFSTKQVLIATTFFQSVSATTSLKSPLTTRFYNSAWDPSGTPLRSSVLKFMEKNFFISNSLKSSSGSRSQAKLFPISISKKKKDQIFTFLFFFRKKPGGGSWRRKNSSYWDFELIDAQMRWSACVRVWVGACARSECVCNCYECVSESEWEIGTSLRTWIEQRVKCFVLKEILKNWEIFISVRFFHQWTNFYFWDEKVWFEIDSAFIWVFNKEWKK